MPAYALAVRYTPPDRENGAPQRITPLAPADVEMVSHVTIGPEENLMLERVGSVLVGRRTPAPSAKPTGKLLPAQLQEHDLRLVVEGVLREAC